MKTFKIIFRGFRKNGTLNTLNISSMAIGIAASMILLGYIYQELNYDSKSPNSNRIYRILMQNGNNEPSGAISYGPLAIGLKSDFPEISDATRVAFYWGYFALTAGDKMFNENKTIFADSNFFNLFSFPLEKGDASKCLSSPNSIVLSESTAKKYFGDNEAIGTQVKIGKDKLFTVQGIFKDFPKNSNFQGDIILPLEIISKITQIWIEPSWNYPSDINTFVLTEQNSRNENLSAKITDYLQTHVKEEPESLLLQSLKEIHTDLKTGWESKPSVNKSYLYFLALVAFVILTMSTANFLLLYIGSSSQRAIHTGVKKVCGASKSAIFRERLQEILTYITFSVIVSLILIFLYNGVLAVRFSSLPSINEFNFTFLIFGVVLVIAFAILTSLLSAIIASTPKPIYLFKTQQKQSFKKTPVINILVISQFTGGIVLLAITFLFYKQLHFMEQFNPGFAKEELITIPLNMPIDEGLNNNKFDAFSPELKKLTGIKSATLAFSSPSDVQTSADDFRCEGMPEGKMVKMQWNSVYYDYFETLGVKIVKGRSFTHEYKNDMVDYNNKRECAYIINQKAAEEIGLENVIGKKLYAYEEGIIVGVVEDFNFKSLHSEIKPMCFNMNPFYYNEIIVRMNPKVPGILDDLKSVWIQFVPDYPFEFNFVNDQIDKMYESENKLAFNLNLFSAIAILIACMGLLALTILAMQKRTKEIGIRKVNGAKVSEVLTMLNKDFIKSVTIAFVIGCPIAFYAMNKWLENFAYKTTISWWIFAFAGFLTLGIALLTVSWQSWRAATRNPIEALRYE